jgi:hypothetical protein
MSCNPINCISTIPLTSIIMFKFFKEKRQVISKILKFTGSLITLVITTFFVQSCFKG